MPRYSEDEARAAVASSLHYTEVLRKLGLRPAGGNHKTLRHWVDEVWKIPTDHFDPDRHLRLRARDRTLPLDEVFVEHSTYNRRTLKRRLYDGGLKERRCDCAGGGKSGVIGSWV